LKQTQLPRETAQVIGFVHPNKDQSPKRQVIVFEFESKDRIGRTIASSYLP
jgi:hypothetical protein